MVLFTVVPFTTSEKVATRFALGDTPVARLAGLTLTTEGLTVSTVTVRGSAPGEVLPAASVAFAVKVCAPSVTVASSAHQAPEGPVVAATTGEFSPSSKSSTLLPASAVPAKASRPSAS